MSELKTKKNNLSVKEFLSAVESEQRRRDAFDLLALMEKWTAMEPKMWGTTIVGFGSYHYIYDSGHEGDAMLTGFSPRKNALTIYIMPGFSNSETLMTQLGKYKTGRSCLYLKQLADVNVSVLEKLVKQSIAYMKSKYPTCT